jgi:RNA polymerase sigma-70 factor (sigma-E family)
MELLPAAPAHALNGRAEAVTALYREHALGLTRMAYVMLGDRTAAEDVVQDAFCGLYRRWEHLSSAEKALPYLRSSVLNGCRTVLRRSLRQARADHLQPVVSAESMILGQEQRREVVAALRRLPDRQREALVLRFYLDLSDAEIAGDMGISKGTVRSTLYRALAALGIALKESS